MSKVYVNAVEPEGASTVLTLGAVGDTVNIGGTAGAGFGSNAPAWMVGINANQSIVDATAMKVELDDVKVNSGFTWDTSNYRGTPGTAGTYSISCFADFSANTVAHGWVYLYVNGVSQGWWGFSDSHSDHSIQGLGGTKLITLGATDYVEMWVNINYSPTSGELRRFDATQCVTYMSGFKLAGV